MGILLGCDEGLLKIDPEPVRLPCPLQQADYLTLYSAQPAALDNSAHLLWVNGHVHAVDSGIEAILFLPSGILTLSGDTDCLTLFDASTGQRLLTAAVGVFPQDMCLIPGTELLAVCGGADGTVRLLNRSDLHTVRIAHVPGSAQRIDAACGWLHVLCLTEDDGLKSLLCRVPLRGERYEPVCALPGIPGAVCADGQGGVWAAVSERLFHFSGERKVPDKTLTGFGLIRHLECREGLLLVCDPVMELCALVTPQHNRQILWEGCIGQAVFL